MSSAWQRRERQKAQRTVKKRGKKVYMCSPQLHYLTLTHTHTRIERVSVGKVRAAVKLVLRLEPAGNIWLHLVSVLMKKPGRGKQLDSLT